MQVHLALVLEPGMLWLPIALVSAGVVLICLKAIAFEMDYEMRRQNLQREAHALRQRQTERLKALGVGRSKG